MSEETFTVTVVPLDKDLVMGPICTFISGTVLGTPGSVFIANAWDVLLQMAPGAPKSKDDWKAPMDQYKNRPTPTDCTFVTLNSNRDRLDYVRGGLGQLKNKTFYGVCNGFTWVTTSILVATKYPAPFKNQTALLPSGTRVETYGIKGIKAEEHMFTVVNRALGSDDGDYRTWGTDCFAVDQWYALQTGTHPVKALTAGTFYDAAFIQWWNRTVPGTRPAKMPGSFMSNKFVSMFEFHTGEFLPEF